MPNDLNRERLWKLLALTQKDNDHEALGAIRKCNQMLAEADVTWEQVLAIPGRQVTVTVTSHGFTKHGFQQAPGDNWTPPHLRDAVLINTMFRAIYAQPRSSNEEFWQFMDDIHQKWKEYGQLSGGQFKALRDCYQRAIRSSRR